MIIVIRNYFDNIMNYEVSEVVGEGDEDEEVVERNPEEELVFALERYKASEIAQLHLNAHNLIQDQKNAMKFSNLHSVNLTKIDNYLAKLKALAKRKKNLENRWGSINSRFKNVMNSLESK